jgi:hypothetical protein
MRGITDVKILRGWSFTAGSNGIVHGHPVVTPQALFKKAVLLVRDRDFSSRPGSVTKAMPERIVEER